MSAPETVSSKNKKSNRKQ